MKYLSQLVLCLGALAACGGGAKSGGDTTATGREASPCALAASQITSQIPDLAPDTDGYDAVVTAIGEACEADGWSAEATTCFADAADPDAMRPCGDLLTPEQQQSLAAQMEARAAEEDAADDGDEDAEDDDAEDDEPTEE